MVLDKALNWDILLNKEGLYIKNFSPTLNNSFQYTHQPQLLTSIKHFNVFVGCYWIVNINSFPADDFVNWSKYQIK